MFTVPGDSTNPPVQEHSRNALGLCIFGRIADRLRVEGFQVTEPKRGINCDAALRVKLEDFNVTAVLGVERRARTIRCSILTWCVRRFWHRVSPSAVSDSWCRLCAAIEQILRLDLNCTSLSWLTREEAEAHWGRAPEQE
jgi:hypothetical protein